jgi:hypothetical protein
VDGLPAGVNDFIDSAENNGIGGGAPGVGGWEDTKAAVAKKIRTETALRLNFSLRGLQLAP